MEKLRLREVKLLIFIAPLGNGRTRRESRFHSQATASRGGLRAGQAEGTGQQEAGSPAVEPHHGSWMKKEFLRRGAGACWPRRP